MTKEDWKKAKEQLERPWPYSRVDLEADGYDVTLEMQPMNDMFHKRNARKGEQPWALKDRKKTG